jgi:hypothetical protein
MSALGQKQTLDWRPLMSAPKADIDQMQLDVRFVPKANIGPLLFDQLVGAGEQRSAVCRFLCGGSLNVPVFERPTFAVRPIRPICRA